MVPIQMLIEKRSAKQNPRSTHSTHTKYVINQSIQILRDLAVWCCGVPVSTHSLCISQPVTTLFTHPI